MGYQDVAAIVKESQPQKYGDEEFEQEPIEDFEAFEDRSRVLKAMSKNSRERAYGHDQEWIPSSTSVSSRDVKLAVLQHRYLSAKGAQGKAAAASLVKQEMDDRVHVDALFDELVKAVAGFSNYAGDVEAMKYAHMRPTDFGCLKSVYAASEASCEAFSDYSLQYVSILVNLCEQFGDSELIRNAMMSVCK